MRAYRYELIAVVFVLLWSILFSVFGIAEGGNTLADAKAPSEPDAEVVSLK
jgi:bacteriorhodopsin